MCLSIVSPQLTLSAGSCLIKSSSLFFSYLHLWISIGFDYSFFDGLLVLSVRSCVYELCEVSELFNENE